MTTPVYMYPEANTSAMEFVLPKKYMEQEAPAPSQDNVEIYQSEPGYFAAVRYGGYSNATKVKTHTERLMKEIEKHSLETISEPVILSYDSPYKVMNRRTKSLRLAIQKQTSCVEMFYNLVLKLSPKCINKIGNRIYLFKAFAEANQPL